MDHDFQLDFVTVFGFNWNKGAAFFGVHRRTVLRWYQTTPPVLVKRFMSVVARGYLPEYPPFDAWKIDGDLIYTPQGKVSASDVELARSYKWQARELQRRFDNRNTNQRDLLNSVERILSESENLRSRLKQVI